jgi:hypothetical protein
MDQLGGFDQARRGGGAVEDKAAQSAWASERERVNWKAEAISWRMAGAPAPEEIDEPSGKFLRPRSDIAHLELLA